MMAALAEQQNWLEIGRVEDIPVLGSRVVESAQGDIAIFRNKADEIFALQDKCPHKGGPLSQGIVHGQSVTCPLHSWCIGLKDGQALAPDEGHTPRYPVEVRDGKIFMSLESGI